MEYKEAHEEILVWRNTLTKDEIGYNPEDIYVLGHDSYNINFDNYRQLTRENLNDLMSEIDEKYGEDAFLIINSMGHAAKYDKDSNGEYDSFFTLFAGDDLPERYYSYEYPNLVYSFLRDDRQVMLNIHKCYAGYIKDAFEENPKDNVLVLASSKRDEHTISRMFLDSVIIGINEAERIDSSYFNSDKSIDGQEIFTYAHDRITGVYSGNVHSNFGTPQMWIKDTTDPHEFIIHTYGE